MVAEKNKTIINFSIYLRKYILLLRQIS